MCCKSYPLDMIYISSEILKSTTWKQFNLGPVESTKIIISLIFLFLSLSWGRPLAQHGKIAESGTMPQFILRAISIKSFCIVSCFFLVLLSLYFLFLSFSLYLCALFLRLFHFPLHFSLSKSLRPTRRHNTKIWRPLQNLKACPRRQTICVENNSWPSRLLLNGFQ